MAQDRGQGALSADELAAEAATDLPEREAMSVILPDLGLGSGGVVPPLEGFAPEGTPLEVYPPEARNVD